MIFIMSYIKIIINYAHNHILKLLYMKIRKLEEHTNI